MACAAGSSTRTSCACDLEDRGPAGPSRGPDRRGRGRRAAGVGREGAGGERARRGGPRRPGRDRGRGADADPGERRRRRHEPRRCRARAQPACDEQDPLRGGPDRRRHVRISRRSAARDRFSGALRPRNVSRRPDRLPAPGRRRQGRVGGRRGAATRHHGHRAGVVLQHAGAPQIPACPGDGNARRRGRGHRARPHAARRRIHVVE